MHVCSIVKWLNICIQLQLVLGYAAIKNNLLLFDMNDLVTLSNCSFYTKHVFILCVSAV